MSVLTPLSNVELFDDLFERLHKLVFAWLLGQTGSRQVSEDLLQETFVRVWSHIDQARQIQCETRKTWVLIVARNVLQDYRRRTRTRSHLNAAKPPTEGLSTAPGPDQVAIGRESMERLELAIAGLPTDLRTVLAMSVVGEMTSEEIGQMLGKPAGTIRSKLFEARKRIAAKVGLL